MLVLTRKVGTRVLIGDNIWVSVVDIRGDVVRLGIEAPKEMPVDREEVALRKDWDRLETVADLEICGLSTELIFALENKFGCIYIRDLQKISEAEILAEKGLKFGAVKQIRQALQNYRDKRVVKLVGECLGNQNDR